VALELTLLGYEDVQALDGGLAAWLAVRGPMEPKTARPTKKPRRYRYRR
jgi:3-mercaptopyruvate sulfurtransferase SseA